MRDSGRVVLGAEIGHGIATIRRPCSRAWLAPFPVTKAAILRPASYLDESTPRGATHCPCCLERLGGSCAPGECRDRRPVGSSCLGAPIQGPAECRGDSEDKEKQPLTLHSQPAFFAGIDWGSQSHQACVLDASGAVLGEKGFAHSGKGLGLLLDWILGCAAGSAGQVRVAIEVPHGPVVDSLLDRGFAVHSINPKQLDRFRDRFSPAGAKDDRRDARVLADAVRTDPHCLRQLQPLDPTVVELREWSRMADDLTAERNRLANRVREQLWRYYPAVPRARGRLGSRLDARPLATRPHAGPRPPGCAPPPSPSC